MQRAVIAALALMAPAFATAALAQNDGPFPGAQPSGSAINLLPALPRPWAPRRLKIEGTSLDVPNDPDDSEVDDPVDAELPGEGPEDLSGPDDDDSAPGLTG
ncbi:MAG: hypothetical protein ACLQF1_03800 [Methyloceanibacter sp.]